MPILVYNSLTRKKEEFIPLGPPKVNIYTCGVTVYDESHIGHARSLYVFDVVRRYLEHKGFKVNFVRNITDIDDKIINRSRELNVDSKELVKKYIDRYGEDLDILGIQKGNFEPRATENIPDMIKYIQGLIDKGYAYQAGGDVYFEVRKFPGYGKLSGQNIEAMEKGVRIEPSELKKDPLDFALWKSSKRGEPSWQSPWGNGRPGWHIECSVMSQKFLASDTLDIHAGGMDLVFPHHENEIAQSEALTGKPFAKYWMHHGLLTINGQKMAKSLKNFVTIKSFVEKYKDIDLLKLFFLSVHYSHPVDFTQERMNQAKKEKKIFDDFFDKVNNWQRIDKPQVSSGEEKQRIDELCVKFEQGMDDDFNTPLALASLFELVDLASGYICQDKEEAFNYAKSRIEEYFCIFGLRLRLKQTLPTQMLKLAQQSEQARRNKDFRTSDLIRQQIKEEFRFAMSNTANSVTFTQA
jgi:cysteinyl-tRNA synthetase